MKDHLESSIFGDHDDHLDHGDHPAPAAPQPVPQSRREARELEQAARRSTKSGGAGRGKPSVLRRLAVIVLALAVIGGGLTVAYTALRPVIEGIFEANDYPGPGTGEVRIKVEQGAGGAAIAGLLAENDVVKTTKAFIEAAKADPKSAGIQPGFYALRKQMKATDALAVLIDSSNRITTQVTIPEGKWAVEIYAALSKQTGLPVADYVAAAKDAKALGLPDAANGNVEGYLFPASYDFEPGTTAAEQLQQMVSQSVKRLEGLGVSADRMEHVVIVASLIEGEAQSAADMAKVSRVIENRLQTGMTLGLDSTVNYIFKKRGVPTADMLLSDSPYNTRSRQGLPPGPISNPGEAAIKAAVNPTPGPWTYFVTVNLDTGETRFTDSDAQFQQDAAQFLKWCETSPKC